MDHEIEIARLEGMIDEIRAKSQTSDARRKHMDYFLEGMRTEAREMIYSARSAEWKDLWFSMLPTFSKPFEGYVRNSVAVSTGKAFSSAKGLYDNLNRLLQVVYLPEEEIKERESRIASSERDIASAYWEAYKLNDLKKIVPYSDSAKRIVSKFEEISQGTGLVRTIRNASEHGHKHALIQRSRQKGEGFALSDDIVRGEPLGEDVMQLKAILNLLPRTYLGSVNEFLQEYIQNSSSMRTLNGQERTRLFGRKSGHYLEWVSRFYGKMFVPIGITSVVLGIVGMASNSEIRKHKDEKTIRQLRELSDFQTSVIKVNKQAENFFDTVDELARQQAVLMSYTNRPYDFDAEKVIKILDKLKKTGEALRQEEGR